MAISLSGIIINGGTSFSKLNTAAVVFEGTNLTLQLPISFAGSPNTFISTNSTKVIPISFVQTSPSAFTATANSALPITFQGAA